jgi:hypothetical protein
MLAPIGANSICRVETDAIILHHYRDSFNLLERLQLDVLCPAMRFGVKKDFTNHLKSLFHLIARQYQRGRRTVISFYHPFRA